MMKEDGDKTHFQQKNRNLFHQDEQLQ